MTDTDPLTIDTDHLEEVIVTDQHLPVRALVKYHHMGDYSVHRFLAEMLTEMKADGAIHDFEILATSRIEWMEVGIYSVDLHGLVQPTMTWLQAKNAVEEYLTELFHDEMLVQGVYALTDTDAATEAKHES